MPRPRLSISDSLPLPVDAAPPVRNTVATVGLVFSILGLLTGGLLSPIGLFASLVGMSRPPRTKAGIGVLLGACGCVLGLTLGLVALVLTVRAQQELKHLQVQQLQQFQQQAGQPPAAAAGRLEDLVGQLDSLSPEERAQLNSQIQDGVRLLDELQRETNGLPTKPNSTPATVPVSPPPVSTRP